MKSITKYYEIKNFCEFTEIEAIGSVENMTKEVIHTIMGNKPVTVTNWVNDVTGIGFEIREYLVAD